MRSFWSIIRKCDWLLRVAPFVTHCYAHACCYIRVLKLYRRDSQACLCIPVCDGCASLLRRHQRDKVTDVVHMQPLWSQKNFFFLPSNICMLGQILRSRSRHYSFYYCHELRRPKETVEIWLKDRFSPLLKINRASYWDRRRDRIRSGVWFDPLLSRLGNEHYACNSDSGIRKRVMYSSW